MSGFDPGNFGAGVLINWMSGIGWRAGKRVYRIGKQHCPQIRSASAMRWAKASQWKPVSLPLRVGPWTFGAAKNEVRASMGIREPGYQRLQ